MVPGHTVAIKLSFPGMVFTFTVLSPSWMKE